MKFLVKRKQHSAFEYRYIIVYFETKRKNKRFREVLLISRHMTEKYLTRIPIRADNLTDKILIKGACDLTMIAEGYNKYRLWHHRESGVGISKSLVLVLAGILTRGVVRVLLVDYAVTLEIPYPRARVIHFSAFGLTLSLTSRLALAERTWLPPEQPQTATLSRIELWLWIVTR